MKGLLFGGCSFTWGQGLYHYSDLERLYNSEISHLFDPRYVTLAQIKMMETMRFSRLVANHFKTFDIQKNQNGGSEDVTFDFLATIFHTHPDGSSRSPHLSTDRYDYDDFDFFIVQLSQIYRNRFNFTLNGEKETAIVWNSVNGSNVDNFKIWMTKNNLDVDEWVEIFKNIQIRRLIKNFQFLESVGIKCRHLSWEDDLIDRIKSNEYLNKRFITIEYNLVKYTNIARLMHINRYLEISKDFENFTNPPKDGHPSKKCHEIIAESIIKNIESTHVIKKTKLPRDRKEFVSIEKIYDFDFESETLPEIIDKEYYLSEEYWNIKVEEPDFETIEDEIEEEVEDVVEEIVIESNENLDLPNEEPEIVPTEPPTHLQNKKEKEIKYNFETYFTLNSEVTQLIDAPEFSEKGQVILKKSMI